MTNERDRLARENANIAKTQASITSNLDAANKEKAKLLTRVQELEAGPGAADAARADLKVTHLEKELLEAKNYLDELLSKFPGAPKKTRNTLYDEGTHHTLWDEVDRMLEEMRDEGGWSTIQAMLKKQEDIIFDARNNLDLFLSKFPGAVPKTDGQTYGTNEYKRS